MRLTYYFTLFLFLFLSLNTYTQEAYPAASFQSPRQTMNYFLKTMKGFKLGDQNAISLATKSLNLTQIPEEIRLKSGEQAAKKLINTLDRIEYVNVKSIPEKTNTSVWYYKKTHVNVNGESYPVEIAISKNKDNRWLFTPQTIASIHHYESSLLNQKVAKGVTEYKSITQMIRKKMPAWTGRQSFILLNGQWLGIFALLFMAFLVEKIVRFYLAKVLKRFLQKNNIHPSSKMTQSFYVPTSLLTFSLLWLVGINFLEFPPHALAYLFKAGRFIFILSVITFTYHLADFICLYLEKKALQSENKFDDILVPLIRKSSKTFIIIAGLIALGDSLEFDMKGLLAGMGIVGLGISLAAKDTISNLFGSLTVLLDRPFRIGDWVVIDNKIEGVVEEVGLRSCRIRTFYNSVITIPNGMLTNAHIDNYGMRDHRRFTTKIGLTYDTSIDKIEQFCAGVRDIIKEHPHTRKENYHVYFNDMGAHSLDVLLYVFFTVPSWDEELVQRHDLLKSIMNYGETIGVNFAFPTQTLHVESLPRT